MYSNILETPVLLIIFNRFDTTRQVFEAIKKQKPNKFFIAADGARSDVPGDVEKCSLIRKWVLENIDWECEVKTLFQEQNLGCGNGPATAISWFFDHVEEGIILEDDCVPDISFFEYCAILLEKYRHVNSISIISGSNFDKNCKYKPVGESYFFSVFPFTWGWATWKRNWNHFDRTIKKWGNTDKRLFLEFISDNTEFKSLWKKIFDDIFKDQPSDIWDYQFFFASFWQKQLSIIPSVNLVTNIGDGTEATHTQCYGSEMTNVPRSSISFPLIHPSSITRNLDYDIFLQEINYGRIENITLIKKIKRMIKNTFKNKV